MSRNPLALGAYWGECLPFVIPSASLFRVPPPPQLTSHEYAVAYEEAKRLGGDGLSTPTVRTAEQTLTGIFWAYDGTPSLCAPPRLYNQIAVTLADENHLRMEELARLLAIVNTADEVAPLASVVPFIDQMPIKDTKIIEYPGEIGVGLQHLSILAGRHTYARVWPEIITWLKARS